VTGSETKGLEKAGAKAGIAACIKLRPGPHFLNGETDPAYFKEDTMKVEEFVKYARTNACVQTGALKTALFIIESQRRALLNIAMVGLYGDKDSKRSAKMREIANRELEREA
jgi:hypothetical protein